MREYIEAGQYALQAFRGLNSLARTAEFIGSLAVLQLSNSIGVSHKLFANVRKIIMKNNWLRRVAQLPRLMRENFFLRRLYLPNLFYILFSNFQPLMRRVRKLPFHPGNGFLAEPQWNDWIRRLREQKAHYYASVYYNNDLWVGNLWNVQTGNGRWHYFLKDNLPLPKGKRILDLGANSGANSIQLLRAGARELVSVELKQDEIDLGRLLLRGFEWMDKRTYNLQFLSKNMNEIPSMDLGRFDMVMALCSLYYLSDEEMAKVTEHVGTITDTFVLECNTGNLERSETHLYRKASVEYAVDLLKGHGFPKVEVIRPKGYYRPLMIGRK